MAQYDDYIDYGLIAQVIGEDLELIRQQREAVQQQAFAMGSWSPLLTARDLDLYDQGELLTMQLDVCLNSVRNHVAPYQDVSIDLLTDGDFPHLRYVYAHGSSRRCHIILR